MDEPTVDHHRKSFSCSTCRRRKIKCDRHDPCTTCVKAVQQCIFIPPTRGKRKRTKAPKEGLHARVRRYEEMLRLYGAKIEPTEFDGDSESDTASQLDMAMQEATKSKPRSSAVSGAFLHKDVQPRLIDTEGSSRYFERYACSRIQYAITYLSMESLN